jgi:uncharacterized metal-binding protein YceD (DUF177 family)
VRAQLVNLLGCKGMAVELVPQDGTHVIWRAHVRAAVRACSDAYGQARSTVTRRMRNDLVGPAKAHVLPICDCRAQSRVCVSSLNIESCVRTGRERRRARSWKSEGSLKLTRGEIEAGLTYARKNLAHFSKQVAFVDCDLSHLDRVGGGGSKVCVDIWVQRIAGSEFFLRSEVAGSLRRECDRCLEAYDETFQGGFHLMLASRKQMVDLARRRADEPDDQDGARNKESKQATADEAIVDFSPDVRLVDVSQEVREAVGGAISLKALCSQSCRGLCYSCGANLNVCGHAASEGSGLQQCAQCCAAGKGARGKGGEAGERAAASGGTLLTQTKSRGGGGGRGVGGALSAGALAGLLKLKSDLEDKQGGS